MAEHIPAMGPVPNYTVRHIDGVMHLSLQTHQDNAPVVDLLRVHQPVEEPSEPRA